jgi:hypothetical protein
VKALLVAGLMGAGIATVCTLVAAPGSPWLLPALFMGVPSGIAGAIAGTDRQVIKVTLLAAAGGWLGGFLLFRGSPLTALELGAPWAAVWGAVAGRVLKNRRERAS